MTEPGRVRPLGQVLANGYVTQKDNSLDYSGMVIHPLENNGEGIYMAPLTPDDPKAMATRLHEYAHLNLITSGEQPTGIGDAFAAAGISNDFLQAMADAKVMTHCQSKGLSLKDLVVLSDTSAEAIRRVQTAHKIKQANLFLRSIGTDMHEFVSKTVTIPERKKEYLKGLFERIKAMRTIEDWVTLGLEYQHEFETPKLKDEREKKMKGLEPPEESEEKESKPEEGEGTLGEGLESKTSRPMPKRKSKKEEKEKIKDFAKKVAEKFEEKPKPKPAPRPESGAEKPEGEGSRESIMDKGKTSKTGGKAVSEEKDKELPDEVYEPEVKEKTPEEEMIQEIEEFKEGLDKAVTRDYAAKTTTAEIKKQLEYNKHIEPGQMTILRPPLEKNFEPKEKAKRAKRSYVGAFRYPHRLVSDSAVFASKLRGKGGTLIIDCSGSMGICHKDVLNILEQRPFATIAIYAGDNRHGSRGYLIILVDRGKCVLEPVLQRYMREYLGCGNIVDVPALEWLCKRSGEKFWICDGGVTGVGDCSTWKIRYQAALLQRRYNVKRWSSIERFLEGRPAENKRVDYV